LGHFRPSGVGLKKGSQDLEIFEMEGGEIEVGENPGYCKLGF
jgi:hypothetical protein